MGPLIALFNKSMTGLSAEMRDIDNRRRIVRQYPHMRPRGQ